MIKGLEEKVRYILIFIVAFATITSMYVGSSYVHTGILGLIFLISATLRDKLNKEDKFVNFIYWLSSITVVLLFVLQQLYT